MNKESRRNFVKKTAVLSTSTLATTLPVDAFANVTENKKLKISLVGCGGRGSGAIVLEKVFFLNVLLVFLNRM